jgi:hypothetical protein
VAADYQSAESAATDDIPKLVRTLAKINGAFPIDGGALMAAAAKFLASFTRQQAVPTEDHDFHD